MRKTTMLAFATVLLSSALAAQEPTWAEHLFQMKTGRIHPEYEKRVKEQKRAQAQAEKQRVSNLFQTLDANRDGVINASEWPDAKHPSGTEEATTKK